MMPQIRGSESGQQVSGHIKVAYSRKDEEEDCWKDQEDSRSNVDGLVARVL